MIKLCYPMLAVDLTAKPNIIDVIINKPSDWIYEPKIDGVRILTYSDGKRLYCWTRNKIRNEKLEEWFKALLPPKAFKNYILDGEVFLDNIRKTVSVISGPNPITKLYYYIFDIVPYRFCDKVCPIPLIHRKKLLDSVFTHIPRHKFIIKVPYRQIPPSKPSLVKDRLFKLVDLFVKRGYEGIMVKKKDSPYLPTRSAYWCKVKKFQSLDLKVIDVVESKTKPGMMGAVVVDACGTPALVGAGFTNKQRYLYWKQPSLIVNKIIEVRYYERTPSGKLRFPVFIRIRDDKDKPDC